MAEKTVQLILRVPPEVKAVWAEAAWASRMSLNAWMRLAGEQMLEPARSLDGELMVAGEGRVMTRGEVAALAAQAERGYDVSRLVPVADGRDVRVTALDALQCRAGDAGVCPHRVRKGAWCKSSMSTVE